MLCLKAVLPNKDSFHFEMFPIPSSSSAKIKTSSEAEKRIPHRKNSKQKEPKKKKKNFKLTTIHRDGYSRKHQNAFHASKHPL